MTAALVVAVAVGIWVVGRLFLPRRPADLSVGSVSDRWRRDHLYTDGKLGR